MSGCQLVTSRNYPETMILPVPLLPVGAAPRASPLLSAIFSLVKTCAAMRFSVLRSFAQFSQQSAKEYQQVFVSCSCLTTETVAHFLPGAMVAECTGSPPQPLQLGASPAHGGRMNILRHPRGRFLSSRASAAAIASSGFIASLRHT